MATAQFNFAEKALDRWVQETLAQWQAATTAIPPTGEAWAQDRRGPKSIPGLYARIRLRRDGTGGWSLKEPLVGFYLRKKVRGRLVTRDVGDRRVTSVQTARDAATDLLKALAKGEDPKETARQEKEVSDLQKLTLKKALEDFLADSPALAEGTRKKYRQALKTTFKDVADKPLTHFTEERVRELHRKRTETSPSRADQDFRVLRLVWNWARETVKTAEGQAVLGPHPVSALNKRNRRAGKRGWNNVPRKETTIPRAKLPAWFEALRAIYKEENSSAVRRTSCLLLEALALTGLRFSELAGLPWAQVDLDRGVLTILDESSKNRRPLIRPLSRRVREILEELLPESPMPSAPVFRGRATTEAGPGEVALAQPIDNTRKLQLKLQSRTGLWITPHDLRRVFSSAATRAGVPPLALKRLLNHQGTTEEVTEGYVRLGLDELLDLSQDVEDQLLRDAGLMDGELDDKLLAVLRGLPDHEKRRLLSQVASAQGDR